MINRRIEQSNSRLYNGNLASLRLLIVSAFYPPRAEVGGKRFAYLCREFTKAGCSAMVLTLPNHRIFDNDCSLPISGEVIRVASLLPFPVQSIGLVRKVYLRMLVSASTPDPFVGWLLPAVSHGIYQVWARDVDIIIATCPPFTSLLVGAIISKLTGKKLIIDYRDPWTGYSWPKKKFFSLKWHRLLERWVVQQAAALVFVTKTMGEEFNRHFPRWLSGEHRTITNGLDPNSVSSCQAPLFAGDKRKRIIYAGQFYGERNIWLVLAPILKLIEQGAFKRNEIVFDVYGSVPLSDKEKIQTQGAEDLVRCHEPLPHNEMVAELKKGDVLTLISGSDVSYALPYKIFDYLSARKPILAIAPKHSEVERFMSERDCGKFAPIDDPYAVGLALTELLKIKHHFQLHGVEQLHWDYLALEYLQLISDILIGKNESE